MTSEKKRRLTRTRRKSGTIRIEDVAAKAGVSTVTISRTLNNPETVSEATRARVLLAVEELGYVPNRIAGGLASSRTHMIGLVIPTLVSNIFAELVRGMNMVLSEHDYQLILAVSRYSLETEQKQIVSFIEQRVSGVCLTGGEHDPRARRLLERSGIPVVETIALPRSPIDMAVGYDNEAASYSMVKYLVSCGYKRIGLITAPNRNNDRIDARRNGYMRAVHDFGLADRTTLIENAFHTMANGAHSFADMISEHPDIDAVFCTNDATAAGAVFEAWRRGIRVPEDIGIAGFDDLEIAQQMVPALTTVRTKRLQIGKLSAEMLLNRINGNANLLNAVDLGYEIIPRNSTARPAASSA